MARANVLSPNVHAIVCHDNQHGDQQVTNGMVLDVICVCRDSLGRHVLVDSDVRG